MRRGRRSRARPGRAPPTRSCRAGRRRSASRVVEAEVERHPGDGVARSADHPGRSAARGGPRQPLRERGEERLLPRRALSAGCRVGAVARRGTSRARRDRSRRGRCAGRPGSSGGEHPDVRLHPRSPAPRRRTPPRRRRLVPRADVRTSARRLACVEEREGGGRAGTGRGSTAGEARSAAATPGCAPPDVSWLGSGPWAVPGCPTSATRIAGAAWKRGCTSASSPARTARCTAAEAASARRSRRRAHADPRGAKRRRPVSVRASARPRP